MRTRLLGSAVVVCAACGGAERRSQDAVNDAVVRDSIRTLSAAVDAAANARDASRLLSLMDSSASFVWVTQGEVEDFATFSSGYRQRFARPRPDAWVRHDSARVQVLGPDLAVSVWSGRTGALSSSGVADSGAFTVMAVWRRGPSGWRIASAHESFRDD